MLDKQAHGLIIVLRLFLVEKEKKKRLMGYSSIVLLCLLLLFCVCVIIRVLFLTKPKLLFKKKKKNCLCYYKGSFYNRTKALNLTIYVCYYVVSTNTTLKVDCGVLYFKVTQHR